MTLAKRRRDEAYHARQRRRAAQAFSYYQRTFSGGPTVEGPGSTGVAVTITIGEASRLGISHSAVTTEGQLSFKQGGNNHSTPALAADEQFKMQFAMAGEVDVTSAVAGTVTVYAVSEWGEFFPIHTIVIT